MDGCSVRQLLNGATQGMKGEECRTVRVQRWGLYTCDKKSLRHEKEGKGGCNDTPLLKYPHPGVLQQNKSEGVECCAAVEKGQSASFPPHEGLPRSEEGKKRKDSGTKRNPREYSTDLTPYQ